MDGRRSAAPTTPELLAALRDKDCDCREEIISALGEIEAPPDQVLPTILQVLEEALEEQTVLKREMEQEDLKAQPASLDVDAWRAWHDRCFERWKSSPKGMRRAALRRLINAAFRLFAQYGPAAERAVPFLVTYLERHLEFSCSQAATALASMGKAASPAIPTLQKMLNGPEPTRIAFALSCISPEHARPHVPLLADALSRAIGDMLSCPPAPELNDEVGPDALVRFSELVYHHLPRALGNVGPAARDAWRPLAEALTLRGSDFRDTCSQALRRIHPTDAPQTELALLLADKLWSRTPCVEGRLEACLRADVFRRGVLLTAARKAHFTQQGRYPEDELASEAIAAFEDYLRWVHATGVLPTVRMLEDLGPFCVSKIVSGIRNRLRKWRGDRRKCRAEFLHPEIADPHQLRPDEEAALVEELRRSEQMARACLDRVRRILSEEEWRVVWARHGEGLSPQEIARSREMEVAEVYRTLERALRRLRRHPLFSSVRIEF